MRDTWYVLEDGTRVSPADVSTDETGKLVHKDGMAVAMGSHGNPRTAGVDLDETGNLIQPREMRPEPRSRNYKTR